MKIKMTITVEESILKNFNKFAKEKSLNKSLFIENKMQEFMASNLKEDIFLKMDEINNGQNTADNYEALNDMMEKIRNILAKNNI